MRSSFPHARPNFVSPGPLGALSDPCSPVLLHTVGSQLQRALTLPGACAAPPAGTSQHRPLPVQGPCKGRARPVGRAPLSGCFLLWGKACLEILPQSLSLLFLILPSLGMVTWVQVSKGDQVLACFTGSSSKGLVSSGGEDGESRRYGK